MTFKKQAVIHIIGLPGSGKSSVAKELEKQLGFSRIEKDKMRQLLRKNVRSFHGNPDNLPEELKEARSRVLLNWAGVLIKELIDAKVSLILEGGVYQSDRVKTINQIESLSTDAIFIKVWLNFTDEVLLGRLKKRDLEEDHNLKSDRFHVIKDRFQEPKKPLEDYYEITDSTLSPSEIALMIKNYLEAMNK